MKKRYEKRVKEALSKITGVPQTCISMYSSLEELAGKIHLDTEGLLGKLCMKLKKRVSNDDHPTKVGDIMIKEKPLSWRRKRR